LKKLFYMLCFFCLFCLLPLPKAQAAMISEKQEIEMGQKVAQQQEAQYGLYQNDEVQARVDRIGQSLVKYSDRKNLTYTFKVLNTQDVNALSCPGGFIYVYKGLLDFMTSDDELAAVIGHEIGHVEKRHTVHQLEKQMALSFLSILAGAAAGDPGAGIALATTASQALMAGYSRADEREADQEGFRMCNEAGYNPYGIYVTMAKLDDMSKEMGNPGYGLFSSHPEPEVRMAKALQWVKPLHIGAAVTVNAEGSATVSQNGWSYTITETAGYDKPAYRVYLMAGALYLSQKRGLDESHFLTMDGDNWSDVYYEDIRILRVYPQDNQQDGRPGELARQIAGKLQDWARAVKGTAPAGAAASAAADQTPAAGQSVTRTAAPAPSQTTTKKSAASLMPRAFAPALAAGKELQHA